MTPNLIIADTFTGAPGDFVTVPISISDATGLQSLDITLKYDSNILTIIDPNSETDTNEGVKRTGIAESWKITSGEGNNPDRELPNPVANVNQETGEVKISLVNPSEPLTVDSGEIIAIDFQINSDATVDNSISIDLQKAEFGINNESQSVDESNLDDGNLTVMEIPTALELTGGTAQIAYVAYYGRPADNGGIGFWNDALTNSGIRYAPREGDGFTGNEKAIYDDIVNQFGNSEEADRLFGGISSNRDKVNQVYQFAFNRDGDTEGLNFWTDQLDKGNVTLATFALEVALGAQNEDIITLNKKIKSADLFSNSIDTTEEINAYQGSSAEIFGREWLDDFGSTISSEAEVDSAITNLVNG